jgi:GH25 family lysozyme M1 (1,4-beta-N-acetylmuramidase)
MAQILVGDFARFQGMVNWKEASKDLDAAIISVGYGSNLSYQDDPYAIRNLKGCVENKLPVAAYLYSYAASMEQVESEFKHILRVVKDFKEVKTLYWDVEERYTATVVHTLYPRWKALCKQHGYEDGLYTYQSLYDEFNMKTIDREHLWIASYGNNDTRRDDWEKPTATNWCGWQFTSNGYVRGVPSRVDLSVFVDDKTFRKNEKKPVIRKDGYIYRLYDNGVHFYTSSFNEANNLVTVHNWISEGYGWKSANKEDPLSAPIYRLYNGLIHDHLYTISSVERDKLTSAGWKYEGIEGHSEGNPEKQVPVYRLCYPGNATHIYTTGIREQQNLLKLGWKYEGIGFYGSK